MRFTIQREQLLKPLQFVIGVVERRQTMAVLSNVLLKTSDNTLSLTATDLEVEIIAEAEMDVAVEGAVTVPARKFVDICKALPDEAQVEFNYDAEKERVTIRSGKSRFTLATLPVADFPNVGQLEARFRFPIAQKQLKHLIEKTQFSMAQQDVRFYLNGLLLEVDSGVVRTVATDGHRLSYCEQDLNVVQPNERIQVIIPRKAVMELGKILEATDAEAQVIVSTNHIQVLMPQIQFTSKLVDGQFPDYTRVMPTNTSKEVLADRGLLKQSLVRTSILSNEKYRGIRIKLEPGKIIALTHNPEMEEAEEELEVNYLGDSLEIGFNVNYLLDALAAIDTSNVKVFLGDSNSSCLIVPEEDTGEKYVVMPMRL